MVQGDIRPLKTLPRVPTNEIQFHEESTMEYRERDDQDTKPTPQAGATVFEGLDTAGAESNDSHDSPGPPTTVEGTTALFQPLRDFYPGRRSSSLNQLGDFSSGETGSNVTTICPISPPNSIDTGSIGWDQDLWTMDLDQLVLVFEDDRDNLSLDCNDDENDRFWMMDLDGLFSDSGDSASNDEDGSTGEIYSICSCWQCRPREKIEKDITSTSDDESDTESESSYSCSCSACRAKKLREKEATIMGEDDEWADRLFDENYEEAMLDDSPAQLEWLRQKREGNEKNEHLDRLMSMVGSDKVKQHFLAIKERVAVAKRWKEDMNKLKLDLVLRGEDGTGKRRIAQLYAEFLFSIGAVARRNFKRTIRQRLPPGEESPTVVYFPRADNIRTPSKMNRIMRKAGKSQDGIVLIFSYREFGQKARDSISEVPEARQRLPDPISLEPYDESQIMELLRRLTRKNIAIQAEVDRALLKVLARRLLKRRDTERINFNLADAAQSELAMVLRRRAERLESSWTQWAKSRSPNDGEDVDKQRPTPENNGLTYDDVLGPYPEDIREKSEAWISIQNMVGLDSVKRELDHLFRLSSFNYRLQAQGKDTVPIALNRLFMGDPGVGKTTVAKLYADVITQLGLVSKGHVIVKNPSNLLGQGIGQSENNTKKALEESQGGVLIIDDAHMLYHKRNGNNDSDSFRAGIIDTLVANIAGDSVEDRCVILIGYADKMEELLLNTNPGLQRRFPLQSSIKFASYNDNELHQILGHKMAEAKITCSDHGREVAYEVLGRMRCGPRFGNGGDIENLLAHARLRHQSRLSDSGVDWLEINDHPLEAQDFDPDFDRSSRADKDRTDAFRDFIGLEEIVSKFKGYQKMADGMRRHGIDPRPYIPWSFVFKGGPGTGKTSAARSIGNLFYNMGLISSNEVMTCSVTDFVGQYVGHTGPKVISQFELGLGKVLFIDEAYRLTESSHNGHNSFNGEAVTEIVDCMTRPRYAGNMVVVLAGYSEDMERLLQSNQGLRSRFSTEINFPNLTPDQCFMLMRRELGQLGIVQSIRLGARSNNTRQLVFENFQLLGRTKGWANGRDVKTLARRVIEKVFIRVGESPDDDVLEELDTSPEELNSVLVEMWMERSGGSAVKLRTVTGLGPLDNRAHA